MSEPIDSIIQVKSADQPKLEQELAGMGINLSELPEGNIASGMGLYHVHLDLTKSQVDDLRNKGYLVCPNLPIELC
jgi:hypothetical protein